MANIAVGMVFSFGSCFSYCFEDTGFASFINVSNQTFSIKSVILYIWYNYVGISFGIQIGNLTIIVFISIIRLKMFRSSFSKSFDTSKDIEISLHDVASITTSFGLLIISVIF